jgi:hypothetical protein
MTTIQHTDGTELRIFPTPEAVRAHWEKGYNGDPAFYDLWHDGDKLASDVQGYDYTTTRKFGEDYATWVLRHVAEVDAQVM